MTTTASRICGPKVRALREQRGWTQEQLSKVSGYALRSIQRAEAGEAVSPRMIKDLATVFQVEPGVLLEEAPLDEATKKRVQAMAAKIIFLNRFTKGRELLEFLGSSHAYLFSHDEPKDAEEADRIGGFFQNLQDWGEVWSEVEQGDRVTHGFAMTTTLAEMAEQGLWVVAGRKTYGVTVAGGKEATKLSTAIVSVVRSTNPMLVLGDDPANAVLPAIPAETVGLG